MGGQGTGHPMGVTYTTAADRDAVRSRRVLTRPQGMDLVLIAASLLADLAAEKERTLRWE